MMKVAINIIFFTKLKNIVCVPHPIHNPPKLWNKMYTTLILTDRTGRCMPTIEICAGED